MEMSCWSVYCPRAFASIEGMEDVIGSRSVQVIMERSFNDEIKSRTVNSEDPVWQELRDELFLVTMTEGTGIKRIYESWKSPWRSTSQVGTGTFSKEYSQSRLRWSRRLQLIDFFHGGDS